MSKFLKFIVHFIVICTIVCVVGLAVPPFLGITTEIMDDSGKETNLPMGSVTYAIPVKIKEAAVGDSILYQTDSKAYRYMITEMDKKNHIFKVIDSSDKDAEPVAVEVKDYIPKVVITVGYAGYLLLATESIEGLIILGLAVLFLVILYIVAELLKKEPQDDYDETDTEPGYVKSKKELKREEKAREKRYKEEERQIKKEERARRKGKAPERKKIKTGGFVDEIYEDELEPVKPAQPETIQTATSEAHELLRKEIAARNLYYKKSGIIAVLVPNVSNPFFAEFVDCVEGELRKAGFKIMLCNTLKDVKAEAEYLDLLNRHIVDGIIAGMSSLDESEYSKIHKPIVALDRYLGEEIPVVAVDHKMGGRLAAEVLLRNGCKRILHFRSTAEKESLYHDRHAEFQKIMDEQGIETYCYDLDWRRLDIQYYHQVAEEVMEKNLKFDGVFGVDRLAIECMNGLLRQHKKIPEEVKIVSYDGTYITELVEPQISTIVQPIDRMAEESVKSLCELINGKKVKNKKSILIPEFRKGGTTV